MLFFFVFKQKTAYEVRISDWSSDVCSSDPRVEQRRRRIVGGEPDAHPGLPQAAQRRDLVLAPVPELLAQQVPLLVDVAVGVRSHHRPDERRVGKEGVSTGRSRWSPYP